MTRTLAGLMAALVLAAAPGARAAPLEAYGRLPAIEARALSPDGAMMASTLTDGEDRTIVVQSLTDGKLVAILRAGQVKVRSIQWAGLDHLILVATTTAVAREVTAPRTEWAMAYDLNLRTRGMRRLLESQMPSDVAGMNVISGEPEVRIVGGRPFVFLESYHFVSERAQQGLFKVDLTTGWVTLEERGFSGTYDYALGPDGEAVAQAEFGHMTGRWRLYVKDGGWRTAKDVAAAAEPEVSVATTSLLGLGRDPSSILVSQSVAGRFVLREVALKDGAWGEPLAVEEGASPIWLPGRYTLAGVYSRVGDKARYHYFDPQDQARWDAIVKSFPGQEVRRVSGSDDGRKVLVLVDSPTLGPAYAMIDTETGHSNPMGEVYLDLKEGDVGPVQPLIYKARDGLELHGYLTIPHGREAKNLPLVVLPHGGPASRDIPGFDWWAQGLASRGYAVLQVNFRGSSGYGWDFLKSGFGEFGRKMQTDLSDGVRFLASRGTIDPQRVCIIGGDYGGYAALAGAALDRGVYRCAASVAGPSDLGRMLDWEHRHHGRAIMRYWTRFMGAENADDPILKAISPVEHAAEVDIPILLIHGKDDTVVPLAQSKVMADALKKAGKPVELLVLKGEDHWLSRGDTRLEMLTAVVAFLEKNNPP